MYPICRESLRYLTNWNVVIFQGGIKLKKVWVHRLRYNTKTETKNDTAKNRENPMGICRHT